MTTVEAIKQWQMIIGVTVDGQFGPATEAATKAWQKDHMLVADGIVGPKTWEAAGQTGMPTIRRSGGAAPSASAPSAVAPSSTPLKAGMLPMLDELPTWVKVGIGGIIVASLYKVYTDKSKKRTTP